MTGSGAFRESKTLRAAFRSKINVFRAVVLRDVRTRFFNHGLGFLLVPIWPCAHLFALLTIWSLLGRQPAFGNSSSVYFATALLPTLTFMYVSRFMAASLLANKPMLSFPRIKILDITFARASLEIIGAFLAVIVVICALIALGEDPVPVDVFQAILALVATGFLAVSVGLIVSVLSLLAPFLLTIYFLFIILIYVSSGTFYVVATLPPEIASILALNPVLHATEWMRSAYYPGYPTQYLDKEYMLTFALVSLFVGLFLERTLRRTLLEN